MPLFKSSLTAQDLADFVARQLNCIIPDRTPVEAAALRGAACDALERVRINFSAVKTKYYRQGNDVVFDHLMGDQYAVFLYYLSNSLYRAGGDAAVCAKIFGLNKCLHGVDMFYAINLPAHFVVTHPLGSVLGNAVYGDYMVFYQGCTVGSSTTPVYPTFEGCSVLYSGSAVIGCASVGRNTVFSRNANVVNTDIPADHMAFGSSPDLILKPNTNNLIERIFDL